jgi:hypothetical protein
VPALQMTPMSLLINALRPRLWWWFAAAVALHLLAWGFWFGIAMRHPVVEVPLTRTAVP